MRPLYFVPGLIACTASTEFHGEPSQGQFSAARLTPDALWSHTDEGRGTEYGKALTGLADFNGDGRPDFAVSAPAAGG